MVFPRWALGTMRHGRVLPWCVDTWESTGRAARAAPTCPTTSPPRARRAGAEHQRGVGTRARERRSSRAVLAATPALAPSSAATVGERAGEVLGRTSHRRCGLVHNGALAYDPTHSLVDRERRGNRPDMAPVPLFLDLHRVVQDRLEVVEVVEHESGARRRPVPRYVEPWAGRHPPRAGRSGPRPGPAGFARPGPPARPRSCAR